MSTTAWPTNLTAYRKAAVGVLPGGAALALLLGSYVGPEQLLAGAIAAAGQLAVLFTARPWLKAGFSWVATALASLALVAGSYEGEGGLTWSQLAQWDYSDLAVVLLLVITSMAHTLIPNNAGVFEGQVLATRLPDDDPGDVVAPPLASTEGAPVVFTPVNTSVLAAVQRAHDLSHEIRGDSTPYPPPRPGQQRDVAVTEAGDDEAPGRGGVHL